MSALTAFARADRPFSILSPVMPSATRTNLRLSPWGTDFVPRLAYPDRQNLGLPPRRRRKVRFSNRDCSPEWSIVGNHDDCNCHTRYVRAFRSADASSLCARGGRFWCSSSSPGRECCCCRCAPAENYDYSAGAAKISAEPSRAFQNPATHRHR